MAGWLVALVVIAPLMLLAAPIIWAWRRLLEGEEYS
jgi:cytochrome c oxidase assembly factor CtaG